MLRGPVTPEWRRVRLSRVNRDASRDYSLDDVVQREVLRGLRLSGQGRLRNGTRVVDAHWRIWPRRGAAPEIWIRRLSGTGKPGKTSDACLKTATT